MPFTPKKLLFVILKTFKVEKKIEKIKTNFFLNSQNFYKGIKKFKKNGKKMEKKIKKIRTKFCF